MSEIVPGVVLKQRAPTGRPDGRHHQELAQVTAYRLEHACHRSTHYTIYPGDDLG